MKRYSLLTLCVFFSLLIKAQVGSVAAEPEMADQFRADGKIYIVITVIAMIFVAIVVFLTLIERKINRLENQMNEGQSINSKTNS
jgi:heme/copper-type cytochrome/quinol oxidase subunit 2